MGRKSRKRRSQSAGGPSPNERATAHAWQPLDSVEPEDGEVFDFNDLQSDAATTISNLMKLLKSRHDDGFVYKNVWPEVIRFDEIAAFTMLMVSLGAIDPQPFKLTQRKWMHPLANRIVAHGLTIHRLLTNPELQVLGGPAGQWIPDLASASTVFRALLDAYLNFFEVFVMPQTDDEFTFFYGSWMLRGLVFLKTVEIPQLTGEMTDDLERYLETVGLPSPSADPREAVEREIHHYKAVIERTEHFRSLLRSTNAREREVATKAVKGLRPRSAEQIAVQAGFDRRFFPALWKRYSGFTHSDGATTRHIHQINGPETTLMVDEILMATMAILARVAVHYFTEFDVPNRFCLFSRELAEFAVRCSFYLAEPPQDLYGDGQGPYQRNNEQAKV